MAAENPRSAYSGWAWAAIVLIVVFGIAKCSSTPKEVQPFSSPSLGNQIEAIQAPPAVTPFEAQAVNRASQHLISVFAAEGLSGAMIYSQNCYDALARNFSWKKLDECGGFDLLTVRLAERLDMDDLEAEAQYFNSEAAAGRYLAATTAAGEEPANADARLEAVKHRAATLPLPRRKAAPKIEEPIENEIIDGDNEVLEG